MELKKIQINNCKATIAEVLSAYNKYVEFGYPKDPNVYEVRAPEEIVGQLLEYIPNIKFSSDITEWPFKIIEDSNVEPGKVIFGPEQVTIVWRNDYGM